MAPALFVILLLGRTLSCFYCTPMDEFLERKLPLSDVQIVMGTHLAQTDPLAKPVAPGNSQYKPYPDTAWRASAYLVPETGDDNMRGVIVFHQFSPKHFVQVTVNITGMLPGKHAIDIHTYGDISQGCKSTGMRMPSNFVGNIEAQEDGLVSVVFHSPYLVMFGFNGIVGRSVVVHSNPIDKSRHPDVFSSTVMMVPVNKMAYQGEENLLGETLMCGVITITTNRGN